MARERGALSFVDDYHGIGIVPLDLHDLGCDLYTAGVLKWLCGGPGLVFLYARRDLLAARSSRRSRGGSRRVSRSRSTPAPRLPPHRARLEHGTPPAPVFFIAQGGLDIIAEVGVERIRARQGELTDHVIARSGRGRARRADAASSSAIAGGVVNVQVGPDAGAICHALLDRNVCTDHRGDGLRISPHFFNTEADIDRCFDELAAVMASH